MSSGGGRAVAFATLLGVALIGTVAEARLPVCGGTTGQNTITSASTPLYAAANVGQNVTFSGTAQSDAKGVTLKLNNSVTASTTLPGSSSQQSWSVVVDSADFATLADGTVMVVATVQLPDSKTADAGSLNLTKNVSPPGSVQNLAGTGGTGQVSLTWTNPTDGDFTLTRILRSTAGYATSPSAASGQTVAFEGAATTATITGLIASTTYFFTAFARDAGGNWSTTAATASAATSGATPTPSPTPTPTNVSFSDNFDTCTASSDLGPSWTTAGIWYCRAGKGRGESAATVALANTPAIGNTDVTARIQLTSSTKGNGGLAARVADGSYYAARMLISGKVQVLRVVGTRETVLGEVNATIKVEPSSHRLRLRVTGSATVQLDVWLDNSAVLSVQDTSPQRLLTGQGGLYNGAAARTQFDDFSLATP